MLAAHRGAEFGGAGCALAVAAHRRSKMQRERREAEREEGQGSVAMRLPLASICDARDAKRVL